MSPAVRSRLALALAAALAAAPAPALAQGPSTDDAPAAAELKRQGDEAMDRRRYADAVAIYLRSLERSPGPSVYYNLARAYEAMGQYPDALRWLQRFEREAPDALKAKVPKLVELLAELRARVTEVDVRVNVAGARVLVRDRLVGTSPLGAPLAVAAGEGAPVEVIAVGFAPHRSVHDLPAGGTLSLDVRLAPNAPPPGPALAEPPRAAGLASRWWLWAGLGTVVVAAGVATYVTLTTERSPAGGNFGPAREPIPTALGLRF